MSATKTKEPIVTLSVMADLRRRVAVTEEFVHWLIANLGAGGGGRAITYKERLEKASQPPPFADGDSVRHTESLKKGVVVSWHFTTDTGKILYEDETEGLAHATQLEKA